MPQNVCEIRNGVVLVNKLLVKFMVFLQKAIEIKSYHCTSCNVQITWHYCAIIHICVIWNYLWQKGSGNHEDIRKIKL